MFMVVQRYRSFKSKIGDERVFSHDRSLPPSMQDLHGYICSHRDNGLSKYSQALEREFHALGSCKPCFSIDARF